MRFKASRQVTIGALVLRTSSDQPDWDGHITVEDWDSHHPIA
jgi:hypothetical protein